MPGLKTKSPKTPWVTSYFRERHLHKLNERFIDPVPRWNGPGPDSGLTNNNKQMSAGFVQKGGSEKAKNNIKYNTKKRKSTMNAIKQRNQFEKKLLKNRRSNCHRTNDLYFCFSYLCFINYRMYLFTILILFVVVVQCPPQHGLSLNRKRMPQLCLPACRSRFYLNGTHQRSFGGSVSQSDSQSPIPHTPYLIPISIPVHTPSLDPSMMAMMKLSRGFDDQRLFFF